MLMLEEKSFLYDLTVQLEVQSILSACIFYRLKYLMNLNIQLYDFKNAPVCLSHLGKRGCSVTYSELSKYFHVDKKRIEYAMKPLKDLGLIGMEYVNVQMGRAPFFFIKENAKRFIELSFKQTRSCDVKVVKETKCFNCAAVYSHVSYWNEREKESLIQSMRLIGDRIGITREKVKLSILKLREFDLLQTTTSTDQRYSLLSVGGGLPKGVLGSTQKVGENPGEGLLKVVGPSIDSYNLFTKKQEGGEEAPPCFFARNAEEQTVKIMHVEITKLQYDELIALNGERRVTYAINRYNRETEEMGALPSGKAFVNIMRYIGFCLENEIVAENKEKFKDKKQEEEIQEQKKHQAQMIAKLELERTAMKNKENEESQERIQAIKKRLEDRRRRELEDSQQEQCNEISV